MWRERRLAGSGAAGGRPRQSALSAPVSTCQRHGPALRARRQQKLEMGGSQAAWMSGPPALCPHCVLQGLGRDRQGTCLESEDNTSLVPSPPLHLKLAR